MGEGTAILSLLDLKSKRKREWHGVITASKCMSHDLLNTINANVKANSFKFCYDQS